MKEERIAFRLVPRTWLGRSLFFLATIAVVIVGAFFITVLLVVAAVVVSLLVARSWWRSRTVRRESAGEFLTAEYTVVHEEAAHPKSPEGNAHRLR